MNNSSIDNIRVNNHSVNTEFSNIFRDENDNFQLSKLLTIFFLIYLYLTIPVQGNFIFRNKVGKYIVLFLSFMFFLFTIKLLKHYYWLMAFPIIIIILDLILIKLRKKGIYKMIFEGWGVIIACCWIVNLMLIMMDILLFLSNIFGVSTMSFTCVFIAVGNNIAGIFK